jgi:spermidine synthase
MLADGAKYVPTRRAACDVLLLDAFEDGKSVRALATQPFYDACRAALRPHGVLAANFMSDEPRLGTYLARIERAFEGRVLCLPSADRENTIVIALRRPVSRLALAPLLRTARELKRRYALPFDRFLRDLVERNPATRDYLLLDKREAG